MAINGKMRPFELRQDLDGLSELVEAAFADDLARRGGDLREEIRSIKRMIPLITVLGWVSNYFRHIIGGFVWEDQGRIVGSVLTQMGNDKTRWHISTIATHPDYRRQGIARKLTARAMKHIRRHGGEFCFLDVRDDNLPAYNLYRSLGFVHYDSTTSLKLEELPSVQAKLDGCSLRPLKFSDWRVRYEMAVRDTPPEVQAFLPVSEAQYRVSLVQQVIIPLLSRLQRVDAYRWAAEQDGQLAGYMQLSARRTTKTVHNLQLTIDPAHRTTLAEPLLSLALETLQEYPRQNVLTSTRTAYTNLLTLLRQYGFVELETMHRLGAKLNHLMEM